MVRFPPTPPQIDEVWSLMLHDELISAEQFALLARWAYVNMSACQRRMAVFDLFEHCAGVAEALKNGRH
jgi:hypothetical protein